MYDKRRQCEIKATLIFPNRNFQSFSSSFVTEFKAHRIIVTLLYSPLTLSKGNFPCHKAT